MRSRCRNCSYFDFCWSEEESEWRFTIFDLRFAA
jgi:hypothetical protein